MWTLRNKFILTYFLVIVVPTVVIIFILFNIVSNTILAQTVENIRQNNRQLVSNVTSVFDDYLDILNRLSFHNNIQNMLATTDEEIRRNPGTYRQMKSAIFNSMIFYDYQIQARIFLLKTGALIDHSFFLPLQRDTEEYALFEALRNTNHVDWSFENDKIMISRVAGNYIGQPLGLTQVVVRERELYTQIAAFRPEERLIVIFDRNGRVISSNNRQLVGASIAKEEYFAAENLAHTGDGRFIILRESVSNLHQHPDWTMATIVPISDTRALSRRISLIGGGIIFACFLISSVIYAVVSAGTLNKVITDRYAAELAVKNITIQKQRAQLNALQNQMHPHFLFNTLESMHMKLKLGDFARAHEMLLCLSKILRKSFSQRDELTSIASELEFVRNYLQIQILRFGDKIQYDIIAPDESLEYRIPRYAIQTLVENAIRHGIEPKSRQGLIRILIELLGNDVKITVVDNGAGMDCDTLAAVVENTRAEAVEHDAKSIGLKNIHDQIQFFCGPEYDISIQSEYDKGTAVSFCFPQKEGYTHV